jgi:hypothetical protein
VDGEARYVSLNGSIFDRLPSPCDFQSLARPVLLKAWQRKWNLADHGWFAHSILPRVSLRPWLEGQKEERSFATSVSRIMSGHTSVQSHLDRFGPFDLALWEFWVRKIPTYWCTIDAIRMCYIGLLFGICVDFLGSFKIGFWSDYFPLCRCGVRNLFHRTIRPAVHLELETPFIIKKKKIIEN